MSARESHSIPGTDWGNIGAEIIRGENSVLCIFAGAGATAKNCTMLFCMEICTSKRFVCKDLYASRIQKDPPDLSSVRIQIISRTKYKRNVTGICMDAS